ncbi:glutathione gamma-glutamylcysteinyltransferase 1-like isoform X2 [Oryza brachyantha]|uniref:glutathione gamma-glutamylcysteinyltransferase 1-like isoform X2 n=1 Tax=Oryza brachyantha TaxID=4533 RepID=UPI001AD95E16|nr:glutathione gamma-glutamylcysteinyltransferase 1-like isoform X2 [Oryza brachyantha]
MGFAFAFAFAFGAFPSLDSSRREEPQPTCSPLPQMASEASSQAESTPRNQQQAAAAAAGGMPSLYGRALPSPPAVEFASEEGRWLFTEALQGGTMQGFFSLVSCFQTQSEPAFCGLATLSVVLNALRIDPGRRWKGPWRWFDESMLDCCEHLDTVRTKGITFGKVACLAHCSGADVRPFRADQATLADLRRHLVRCASSQDCHLVVSYHRKLLGQTGTGHFSPIGGYHAGEDMALILDVARFKYPPHWVPLPLLWEAMNTIDEATGLLRGFMLISRNNGAPSLICTSCRDESWQSMAKYCIEDVPNLLKDESVDSVLTILSRIVNHLPPNAGNLIKWVIEVRRKEEGGSRLNGEANEIPFLKEKVLQQIRDTKLFRLLHKLQCSKQPCRSCSSSRDEDSIAQSAASVCCQGDALLNENLSTSNGFCIRETCSECVQVDDEGAKIFTTSSLVSEGNEQGVDKLSPISLSETCSCKSNSSNGTVKNPSSTDILTVLLLSLHPSTWLGIEGEKLKAEFQSLVSTDSLPDALKLEILHLRRQLRYLKACQEKEAYEDPLSNDAC